MNAKLLLDVPDVVAGGSDADAEIIGATKMHHLEEAIAGLEVKLSQDEMKFLEELYQPHPVLGHS